MTIGKRIREIRKSCGLSMAELGERVGVTAAAVSRYELGQREISLDMLGRIANALGVHILDLTGIGEKMDKLKIEYGEIKPISGNPEDLTPEKIEKLKEILPGDARELYDTISSKAKMEFWQTLTQDHIVPDFNSAYARINAALDQLPVEGQEKVATYAEDLIPRYRAETTPQPAPPKSGEKDTPNQGPLQNGG